MVGGGAFIRPFYFDSVIRYLGSRDVFRGIILITISNWELERCSDKVVAGVDKRAMELTGDVKELLTVGMAEEDNIKLRVTCSISHEMVIGWMMKI